MKNREKSWKIVKTRKDDKKNPIKYIQNPLKKSSTQPHSLRLKTPNPRIYPPNLSTSVETQKCKLARMDLECLELNELLQNSCTLTLSPVYILNNLEAVLLGGTTKRWGPFLCFWREKKPISMRRRNEVTWPMPRGSHRRLELPGTWSCPLSPCYRRWRCRQTGQWTVLLRSRSVTGETQKHHHPNPLV